LQKDPPSMSLYSPGRNFPSWKDPRLLSSAYLFDIRRAFYPGSSGRACRYCLLSAERPLWRGQKSKEKKDFYILFFSFFCLLYHLAVFQGTQRIFHYLIADVYNNAILRFFYHAAFCKGDPVFFLSP